MWRSDGSDERRRRCGFEEVAAGFHRTLDDGENKQRRFRKLVLYARIAVSTTGIIADYLSLANFDLA